MLRDGMPEIDLELARCQREGVTHHAGCACHEQAWQNKWEIAIEMAAQAMVERDDLRVLAGELVAFIRVNVMRDTFTGATIEQVDESLAPFVERLNYPTYSFKAAPVSRDG
jgi:hypothetical protein